MRLAATARARGAGDGRRAAVEDALRDLGTAPGRRSAPPEGRLGAADYPVGLLRATLVALGPVFADFGRYLASRPDLLPRRYCTELSLIEDAGAPIDRRVLADHLQREFGVPIGRHFAELDVVPDRVTIWTEQHRARTVSGLPARVTVVRPDAAEWIARDVPLLTLLAGRLPVDAQAFADAIDDFAQTLRLRVDQTLQAAALATLAADAPETAGLAVPACYRDACTACVLTTERYEGADLAAMIDSATLPAQVRVDLARRVAGAWLRQALVGRVVPFDFTGHDIVITDERIVLLAGACETQGHRQRERFSRYVNAVAADDPDAAAAWILDAAETGELPAAREEALRRRFRQAVPFRDGEWSSDEGLAEYALVQWRAASESGWRLLPYHVHLYRGLARIAAITNQLAPAQDSLLVALQDARLLLGAAEAAQLATPEVLTARFENALREMMTLPQKLDDVLTLAAEGRLRIRFQVPPSGERRSATRQTVQLLAAVVLLVAIGVFVRQAAPAYGPGFERVGSFVLLAVGAWLLVAAAKV